MATPLMNTGIELVGEVPWGTHFCHFFETKRDLLDTLIPYFKAGLEAGEFCVWLVAEPLTEDEARGELGRVVPDLDRHLADRSIEIRPARDWYLRGDGLDLPGLTRAWDESLEGALKRGFPGMRVNGSTAWLEKKHWDTFSEYEEEINGSIAGKRMVALCTYPLSRSGAAEVLDVARTHQFALAKRSGSWEIVETAQLRQAKHEISSRNAELQLRVAERTAQLEGVNEELRARNRQQAAVASLGLSAIRAQSLATLLDESATVAAQTLGMECSAVAELLPNGEEFRVRSGVGWMEGIVDRTWSAEGTPAEYMLRLDGPVVIQDARTESRFPIPRPMLERGVASAMYVLIRRRTHPWGALSVYSTRPRSFSSDEVGFLESVANVLALAVERHELEVARHREKEVLEAIFDSIPVMISFYDSSGRLTRANPEWERTLGWTLEEARQLDILAELYPDPEERRRAREFMRRAEGRWGHFRPRTREGRFIETTWARFALSDGSRIGFGIDVTEQERAEEERARLLESETRARADAEAALERLRVIQSITDTALARLGLDELLDGLLTRLLRALDADYAHVQLVDGDGRGLHNRAWAGLIPEHVTKVRVPFGKGVSGRILAEGRPLIVNDFSTFDLSGIEGAPTSELRALCGSVVGAPLQVGDRIIGVVGVGRLPPGGSDPTRPFTEEDLKILLLVADRVAPAIEGGRLVETVRAGRERMKTLSRRLLTAQEEERRRLAVELHDELGQALTAVKINLESLARSSGAGAAPGRLEDMIDTVDQALQRVRDLALDLRPSVLDDLGLPAALRWYVDRFARDARIEAHLSVDAVPDLEPALQTACFRVAQEALTNVARHAQARHVWLDLHLLAEGLELRVRDDGIGFDAGAAREHAIAGASIGLLGMQERVSLVGGRHEVRSAPGKGTEVLATFPVGEKSRSVP